MLNKITRRTFLASATSAFAFAATPLLALTEAGARGLVDGLVAKINSVIASGKSEAGMIKEFQGIFKRYADVPIMAQYALGVMDVVPRQAKSVPLARPLKAILPVNTASVFGNSLAEKSK